MGITHNTVDNNYEATCACPLYEEHNTHVPLRGFFHSPIYLLLDRTKCKFHLWQWSHFCAT